MLCLEEMIIILHGLNNFEEFVNKENCPTTTTYYTSQRTFRAYTCESFNKIEIEKR